MNENHSGLYSAFCAKDTRFDGRFFVGVSSTGIYCRPVCRARMPKAENCTFFASAAAAELAGYRPCLICRPELAPGRSVTDASASLAGRAARLLEERCGCRENLKQLAGRLGCTDRHLRRVFEEEFHVTPVQYLLTCRLLLAKKILTDTNLPVIEAAFASGFKSLRRFNDAFKLKYRLTPSDLRRQPPRNRRKNTDIRVFLGYRPPYRWREMLAFLKPRTIPGIDLVQEDTYSRTVCLPYTAREPATGWLTVAHCASRHLLEVTLSESLLPVLPRVLGKVQHMFDLYCDPEVVFEALRGMNEIRPGLCVKGTRLPGCFDPFETAVRAILGQQITVRAASTLAGRLAARLGTPMQTPIPGLSYLFPAPERLLRLEEYAGELGLFASRAGAIAALAAAMRSGALRLDGSRDPEAEMQALQSIKGIGAWTANYIAMRSMAWPDAFPATDAGIRHALPGRSPRALQTAAEPWRPWRSYAVLNLWNSLAPARQDGVPACREPESPQKNQEV